MSKIRVLVVEDSLTVRKRLVEILCTDSEIEVAGEAEDGKQAIELCQSLRPSVVTMDMMLPVMTGLSATEYIMAYCPTPILIVSASMNRGEVFKTYEALAAGALEVFDKPAGDQIGTDWEQRFLRLVKMLSRIKVITHPRARLKFAATARSPDSTGTPLPPSPACRVAAIGASTGGPGALVEIFKTLPRDFPLPILLVVHISRPFASAFAEWLDSQSVLRVAYAKDGETVAGEPRIILAPPDEHMIVLNGKLRLGTGPERHSCRPSIDVLFESVAREFGGSAAACLLTGMGRDGAEGLLAIRRAGGRTIAQDEATSVVFGMPREAIQLNAAEQILPLPQIAAALEALITRSRR
jgi:two-component system chemotaxis response regulator CheB